MTINGKTIAIAFAVLYLGACVALRATMPAPTSEDRGLTFPHEPHVVGMEMECSMCHDFAEGDVSAPTHELCGVCHDIPEDNPTEETCGICHTRADYTVDPRPSALLADIQFVHTPHIDQELDCAVCHEDPDTKPLPRQPLKPFCMDCHGDTRPELNECSVCHETLTKDTIPTSRGGMAIAHGSPDVWEHVHGREARLDANFCAQCHSQENDCEECHTTQAPDSHTPVWRRKSHGLHATWDRQSCATCHEEDTCLQCHQNSEPASHRGRFGAPVNTHCVSCHMPAEQNNCTVCHEEISHPSALPSPHAFGVYPPDCARCHPGGLPTRAPHFTNSSVRCIVCHK